jgi:hypothetical protein
MADKKWKVIGTKGGSHGKDLDGCLIEETDNGFVFKDKQNQTLAGTGRQKPTLPFAFPEFDFDGHHWTIWVTEVGLGKGEKDAAGDWKTHTIPSGAEDGTWVAQAGGGPVDEEAETDVTSGQACSE